MSESIETTPPTGRPDFDTRIREAQPVIDMSPQRSGAPLGPESLTWKFFGDVRGILGFQRAAGTENCIEQLGQGVLDHSVIFDDFIGRAKRTGPPIMKTVYGADDTDWGHTVRDFHRDIKGTISDGSRYHALNPELYYWAHATFVETLIFVTDTFIRRLSYAEKCQIFDESKTWYARYGISARDQPATYDEFCDYFDSMCQRFVPHKTVVYATGYIRKGVPRPRRIPAPVWAVLSAPLNEFIRTVIVGTVPQEMRDVCDLPWNAKRQKRFDRFAAAMRLANPLFHRLPLAVLYTPWAHEAWVAAGVDPRRLHNRTT
ncbi:oxygenase MpaB family protein [Williamsia sp. CHRR-6]|uniref:oxygenase MpaB family protein n=1 Tax=Williamsia sp. CHRR-6 TaxID=2835871 RepID=UPI001BDAD68E|nr:oxygenase MpaB family protein [Williamsia sp. CHRR-6]MBT0565791.1 DUF2236 domain-containing protein [Williamsia sp. CHRR-6]